MICHGSKMHSIAFAALLLVGAGAAHADLVVVSQNGTGYKKDQKLTDGAKLDVPQGGSLTLRRVPEGTEVTIDHAYSGTLADYKQASKCPWYNPLCGGGDSSATGGTPGGSRGSGQSPGGTRGGGPIGK